MAEDLEGHFGDLIEEYEPRLRPAALSMVRHKGRAQEMVQRTWIIAYRTLKRYREEFGVQRIRGLSLSGWLRTNLRVVVRLVESDLLF